MNNGVCKICNGNNLEVIIKDQHFEILRCKYCGLFFQNTLVDIAPLSDIYNNIYEEAQHSNLNELYCFFRRKMWGNYSSLD